MNGASIATAFAAIITGIIIADVLIHPAGSQAAANGIATVTKPAYNALLGYPS